MKGEPTSQFIKVRCAKCKNEQTIFNKASSIVKCTNCGKELSTPTGGKAKIKARLLEN
jgi:small subunit ribosomal protein S27e